MEKHQIRDAYKMHLLENGHKPASVYAFAKSINIPEASFYDHYSSFEALEKDIWLAIFESVRDQLLQDDTYRNYSAREKLLAFYFLWVQKLKENRSFVLLQKERFKLTDLKSDVLENFRKAFLEYAGDLIKSGYETREIKERKYISDKYTYGFWLQALFVLKYWTDDTSPGFEMTDAAIEKAVNLSFKLVGDNTIDGLIDFGKFILTKK